MNYEVCNPAAIYPFEPRTNFLTFQVKASAGEEFVAVNNCVAKCCQDIENIRTALTTIKTKMGENCGSIKEIDTVKQDLSNYKERLITKNKELINACELVVQYIYQNKSSKSEEASRIALTISNISVYEG